MRRAAPSCGRTSSTSLQSLFEDVTEEFVADDLLKLSEVQNASELGELLCSRLGRDVFLPAAGPTMVWQGLLRAMQSDGEYQPLARADRLGPGLREPGGPGAGCRQGALRPITCEASATRLGTFAACPYQHFVRYVLDLKPRREFKLEPLDLGLFYHGVLDSLQKRLADEKTDIADIEAGPPRAGAPRRDRPS